MAKKNNISLDKNTLKKIIEELVVTTITTAVNSVMKEHADDYDKIYRKIVTKFYSTYSTKKYIRHGFNVPGAKKGINLYSAIIKKIETTKWQGNSIISEVVTDKELQQQQTNYNTDSMLGYTSLVDKDFVQPQIILSNMMFGIRFPAMPNSRNPILRAGKDWRIKNLKVKTSFGELSASNDTPASLFEKYEELFEKNAYGILENRAIESFNKILKGGE